MNNSMITMSDLSDIVETDPQVKKATVERYYLFNPKRTQLLLAVWFKDGGYWSTAADQEGNHFIDASLAIMLESCYTTFETVMEVHTNG